MVGRSYGSGSRMATRASVAHYLVTNYARISGQDLTYEEADRIIGMDNEVLDQGIWFGSNASYVGDQIADAEGLLWGGK